jgi:hypothetical protein
VVEILVLSGSSTTTTTPRGLSKHTADGEVISNAAFLSTISMKGNSTAVIQA